MKKMEKAGAVLITMAVICGLTACGGNTKETEQETGEQQTEQSAEMETAEADEEENVALQDTEAEITEPDAEVSDAEDGEMTGETVWDAEPEEFVPVAGLSDDYADLENRCFAYKGQIYTLGESTLQDLIDGGVPFEESALNNIGNNVNSNYETDRYDVEINDYVHMQFSFVNTTETNITEADCVLHLVRWSPLYVPQPDYEEILNEEIARLINDASDDVCFSFPLTLTKEQLLENNANATEINEEYSHANTVNYRVDSEVYMGESGYTFIFNKKTDQLQDVTISWLP